MLVTSLRANRKVTSPGVIGAEPAQPLERLATEVERVSDRLRTLPQRRLEAPSPPYDSVAAAARALAQQLADAAQGVDERARAGSPRWREVPALGVFAAGDQVTVTGRDLLAALAGVPPETPVWTRDGRGTAADVAAGCLDALRRLRLAM
jgi:hypothetical protein